MQQQNDTLAGDDSSNIGNQSWYFMILSTPTVWEASLHLYSVGNVDKGRILEERVSIPYKSGMQLALAAQSAFNP